MWQPIYEPGFLDDPTPVLSRSIMLDAFNLAKPDVLAHARLKLPAAPESFASCGVP